MDKKQRGHKVVERQQWHLGQIGPTHERGSQSVGRVQLLEEITAKNLRRGQKKKKESQIENGVAVVANARQTRPCQ